MWFLDERFKCFSSIFDNMIHTLYEGPAEGVYEPAAFTKFMERTRFLIHADVEGEESGDENMTIYYHERHNVTVTQHSCDGHTSIDALGRKPAIGKLEKKLADECAKLARREKINAARDHLID